MLMSNYRIIALQVKISHHLRVKNDLCWVLVILGMCHAESSYLTFENREV